MSTILEDTALVTVRVLGLRALGAPTYKYTGSYNNKVIGTKVKCRYERLSQYLGIIGLGFASRDSKKV